MRPEYSPSRDSLYHPESGDPLFIEGQWPSLLATATEASRLAYIRAEISPEQSAWLCEAFSRIGFSRTEFFSDKTTGSFALGTYRAEDKTALLSFRGTQPDDLQDLLTDVNLPPKKWGAGKVHGGFARAADTLRADIESWLHAHAAEREALVLCGHSLGAALATLFAALLNPTLVVTLGSPRVGNRGFAKALKDTEILRLVNCCDFITKLPIESPNFRHIGTLKFINHLGELIAEPTEAKITADETLGRNEYFQRYGGRPGIVLARDLADHSPINYVRAFFPDSAK
jgi:surfactin synthase thioesterase subunit